MIKTKRLFTKLCIKTIALQNTEEALLFRSAMKKKRFMLKSISAPSVRGDFHIHIGMNMSF